MWIVSCGDERCIARTVCLDSSKDGASVYLTLRERLLQRRMLRGFDGINLVEVYKEVVRQSHLLVELVREVKMIQIVLSQLWWQ